MLLSNNEETPKLEFKKSHENKDFFALATNTAGDPHDDKGQVMINPATKRRNSTVSLVKELLQLTLQENQPTIESNKSELKSIVIELEQDDEFFKMLMQELSEAAMLQDVTKQKFDHDISNLEGRMTKVVSTPCKKKKMLLQKNEFFF